MNSRNLDVITFDKSNVPNVSKIQNVSINTSDTTLHILVYRAMNACNAFTLAFFPVLIVI